MTMPDLVRQILAAIEETAAQATQASRYAAPNWSCPASGVVDLGEDLLSANDREVANHIARHDPASVLQRCAADRRIVETCQFWLHENDAGIDPCAAAVLRDLADAYDVHPTPEPGSPMADDLAEAAAGEAVPAEVIVRDLAARAAASATVHQEEDWFIAQATSVNVASQGRTEQEARANLREAVELHLTTRQPIPHIKSHDYLSTACFHREHGYCDAPTVNRDGSWSHIGPSYSSERDAPKNPAQCKFCKAPCRCQCHQGTPR